MGAFAVTCLLLLAYQATQIKGRHYDRHFGIIHGEPVKIEDAPYMAQFRLKDTDHYCGASVVGEQFLLTAGHCYQPDPSSFFATVGTDTEGEGQNFEIESLARHPNYGQGGFSNNDVTVIKIKGKISFNEKIQPIKMADPNMVIEDGAIVTSLGFGVTESGNVSNILMKVDLPIINTNDCENTLETNITEAMICAGAGGKGDCNGDSGGPLVYKNTLIGIVSFGTRPCAYQGAPTVFGRVSALRDFIDGVIKSYS